MARASDDFYPRDPTSSHPHIAACAYNTLFLSAILHVRRCARPWGSSVASDCYCMADERPAGVLALLVSCLKGLLHRRPIWCQ